MMTSRDALPDRLWVYLPGVRLCDRTVGRWSAQLVSISELSACRATWRSHGGDIGAVEAISWRALRYQLAVRPRVISSRMAGDLHLEMGDTADF